MILGPSYKFPSAINALENMKKVTKREVIKFEDIITPPSKELKDKAVYMQAPDFFENSHNKKMYALGKKLGDVVANGGDRVKEYYYKDSMKKLSTNAILDYLFAK